MKVAIISSYPVHLLPEFQGLGNSGRHYATWLPQLSASFADYPELEVHWVVLTRLVDSPRVVHYQGQQFHILPMAKAGRRVTSLYLPDLRQISDCLKRIGPDVVHGWGSEDIYGLAATFFKGPSIVSFQGILTYYLRRIPKLGVHALAHVAIEQLMLSRAQLVTVESAWGAGVLRKMRPSLPLEIIEYGVDQRYLSNPWNPSPDRPRFLFVGSLDQRKGIQDLVTAFAHPSLSGAELLVAGGGSAWAAALQKSATPNIRWLGYLQREEVAELMQKSWALLLPTRADTSPNVVKEARVTGLPVIASPHGGQTSYIEHGENGFLVENGDIPALVEAIRHIASDLDRCRAMGAWKHEEHRALLSPQRTAASFAALYQRVYQEQAPV